MVSDWLDWDDAVRAAREGEDLIARNRQLSRELAEEAGDGACGATHHPAHTRTAGPDARPHHHPSGLDTHIFYNLMMFFNWAGELYDAIGPGPNIYFDPNLEFAPEA